MKRLFSIFVLVGSMSILYPSIFGITHGLAFQEQQVGGVTASERGVQSSELALRNKTGVLSSKNGGDKGSALSGIDPSEKSKKSGTTLHIPGIGTLGTLPELDFGLELLYKDDSLSPSERSQDDGMAIKGRIKHKF